MTLKEQINHDFIQARKEKDILKANVLRLIKSHFDAFKIDNGREMDEKEVINYLLKEQKQTDEALAFAKEANRPDLIEENENKRMIIQNYLPQMMSEEDIRTYLVEQGIGDLPLKDAMKRAMSELDGKAEKRVVSQLVKELTGK